MYVIQWKGRPYHCVGTNITRILYHAARAVSTVSCRFSLLVEDTALSISKTDAYFSITSARKVANALHSSSVGVEHSEGVGLFSIGWKLFNRQLHFLVAELRTSCGFLQKCFWSIRLKFLSVPAFPVRSPSGSWPQCRKSERTFPAGGHRCGRGRYPVDAVLSAWIFTPFRLALARLSPGIPCRRSFDFQGSMKACRKHITMKQKFSGSIPSAFDLQNRK